MDLNKLKEYYNRIDKCSVSITQEIDFDYIQLQISKIAIHTEELNTIIGEILVEKTRMEHLIMDKTFEYELRFTELTIKDETARKLNTGKERKDYINYVLLKDSFKELTNLSQELKDIDHLLRLADKKAKDLDKTYPKLKTLWDAVQTDLKYLKKKGSDFEYIEKVRGKIKEDQKDTKPIFTDTVAEQIKFNTEESEEIVVEDKTCEIIEDNSIENEVDGLLQDL